MESTYHAARDFWTHRDAATLGEAMRSGVDLVGLTVEATDGRIGKVTEATYETSRSYIVVDTGPWLLGQKVVLPAGVIDRIDFDTQTLLVNCTKHEIKNAPEFDASRYEDEGYRAELSGYYGGLGTHPVSTF
jgi:hypothetical protein